jgi:hypothetical protein
VNVDDAESGAILEKIPTGRLPWDIASAPPARTVGLGTPPPSAAYALRRRLLCGQARP